MIKPLQYRKAISIIKEITTEGHSPLLVLADDYEKYIIKTTRGRHPDFYLINEFLCHQFLNLWNIPSPDIIAVFVDKSILPGNLSNFNKPSYFDNICFGSKFIESAYELNEFISTPKSKDFKKIKNVEVLYLIALFDIWVENDDRKPTNNNILLSPSLNLVAIDNAFVFSSMSYEDLNADFVSSSYNDTILHSPIGQSLINKVKPDNEWLNDIKDNFYLCIENCKHNYIGILGTIPEELGFVPALSNKIFDFLFNEQRNEQVFTEFISRLK